MIKKYTLAVLSAVLLGTLPVQASSLVATTANPAAQLHNVEAGSVYENRLHHYERKPEMLKSTDVDISNRGVGAPQASGVVVSDDISLYLEKVVFDGNTAIKTADLQKLASEYLVGRDVTLAYVGKFVEKVTKMYQDQGYITSFAFLPPQTIKDKTITIQIFEGKIGDVAISGNKFSSTNFIRYQLIKPYFVDKGEILNVNDIRRAMIELNEKGYISGSIVLEKGKEKGTTDLHLSVKDKQPFTTSISFDNAGREIIGKHRFSAFVSDNNLTGHGDVLSAGVSFSEDSFSVGPQYMLPIGTRGDQLYASYGYSYVKPGGIFKAIDYKGDAHITTIGMKNPIYKGRNVNVDLNTNFNIKEGEYTFGYGGHKFNASEYSIRTLETGLQMVQRDKAGRTYVNAGANIGLPILGSHDDSQFMALNGGVVRQFWLPGKGVAIMRFNGQVSPDSNIPTIEQFQMGGFQTVRGYDEGTLLGKSGFTAGLQVNVPIPFLPKSLPIWKNGDNVYRLPIRDRIQLIGFYDCGYARVKDYDLGAEFLQSVGTGLRVYLTKYLTASVDFGFPIGERPDGSHRFRTHFFLTSNIL